MIYLLHSPAMTTISTDFRREIREAMQAQGLTQQALADASGVSRTTISRYLSGSIDLRSANVARLLDATRAKTRRAKRTR